MHTCVHEEGGREKTSLGDVFDEFEILAPRWRPR